MPFIEIEKLTHRYKPNSKAVLKDVSLSIESGEYICIVGSNGSGKSTLIRMLNGLLQPESGSIKVEKFNTSNSEDLPHIRRKLGMVFQNPENQLVSSLVEEEVAFGPENLSWSRDKISKAVDKALNSVDMMDYRYCFTHELSAGQQQRIALAGVLAMDCQCLILDEATSMLNPSARIDLLDILDKQHKSGKTIISVTHHFEELLRAELIILLDKGEFIGSYTPESFLRLEGLRERRLCPLPWTELARLLDFQELPISLKHFKELLTSNIISKDITKETESLQIADNKSQKTEADILCKIQDLKYHYNKEHSGGIELSELTIYRGERLILVGETGSGKSTLLQLLSGVREKQEGLIEWRGPAPVRGLVMQNPAFQLFKTFVGDDVAFGPSNQGIKGRALAERVRDAMAMAGLSFKDFKDRNIRTLSGGEKRKAALAGILSLKPDLLLLDEPAAGLDPVAQEELEELLNHLQQQGCTLVIATHNMESAARGDRVLYLKKGKAESPEPAQLFFQKQREGLANPPAAELSFFMELNSSAFYHRWDVFSSALIKKQEAQRVK